MKALRSTLVALAGLTVAIASPLRADFVSTAILSPAADGATNSNGYGSATVMWNSSANDFSYTLSWSNLTGPATMGHIHYGAPGVVGPIVVPFFMPAAPSGYLPATDMISGTLTASDLMPDPSGGILTLADVATAIQNGDAYVNIHTSEYPAGELRGQLTATPEPASVGLVFVALAGGVLIATKKRRLAVASSK